LTLKELEAAGLIERRVVLDVRPPRAEYRLAPPIRRLVPALRELAAMSR
jgi:DNA-binding HxlR family transcriptional regulator